MIQAKPTEAADQAQRYGLTDLRLFAVVGVGLERVIWRAVQPVAP